MLTSLGQMRALIIDMDGVIWHGDTAVPGLVEFFELLRRRGILFMLATNNASRTPEQFQQKLAGMGVEVRCDEILTSAQATALYLKTIAPGARVFVIGEDGLKRALTEMGFSLCNDHVDYVICGMDRGLSWEKLAQATLNIRAGAIFIGTNSDKTFPTERGFVHGNGAILAALETATDVKPIVVGKPEPIMYQQAMSRLGVNVEDTAALGDRLETDILGAKRAGIASILVFSGVSTREDLKASEYKSEWAFQDLQELTAALDD
jgi:4-nitrophenyl phosphatase